MRRPVLLGAVILLLVYIGLAVAHQREQRAASPGMGVAALQRAVAAAGGAVESATLVLSEPVGDPAVAERLAARMGWETEPAAGELRTVDLVDEAGGPALRLTWRLTGGAAAAWAEQHAALRRALAAEGVWAPIQVELEGMASAGAGPLALAHAALDGVEARKRQPWSDGRAASVAGWSPLLPPGPYEVNVQVAVRRQEAGSRFWIGWPAVRSDY